MTQLLWLVRREFWEHKGGFVVAPVVVGALYVVLMAAGLIWTGTQVLSQPQFGGVPLSAWVTEAAVVPDEWSQAVRMLVYSLGLLLALTQGVMAFFYCVGALYDERKTRQALFWKSLPMGDGVTVASKAVTVLLAMPLVNLAVLAVASVATLIVLSVFLMAHGVNPWTVLWAHGGLFNAWAASIGVFVGHAVWALPVVGYWLFWSAAAPRMPLLWGGLVVMAAVIAAVVGLAPLAQVLPLALGAFVSFIPGVELLGAWDDATVPSAGMVFGHLMTQMGSLATWVGILVGVGLLVGATQMRKRREEG